MDDDMISDRNYGEAEVDVGPSPFREFYYNLLFLASLYVAGDIVCRRFLVFVPPLVGQIGVGILFGPQVFDLLSPAMYEGWVTLGNLGLVLLICQAGLDMDLDVLRRVGPRGAIMAVVGSILPIGIGILLSRYALGLDVEASISAGCSFGPTSAGIAMNVLKPSGILQKDVGQLIVAIAIVDDILALVVLSQLGALVGPVELESILVPVVSSLLWLLLGGAIALFYMPKLFKDCQRNWTRIRQFAGKYCCVDTTEKPASIVTTGLDLDVQPIEARNPPTPPRREPSHRSLALAIASAFRLDDQVRKEPSHAFTAIALLIVLLPATFYSDASYLLGAFVAGLSCCHSTEIVHEYDRQLKQWITWLMRIFFGATIGLQIPVTLFNDLTVVWQGFVLSLSLLGKVLVGPLLTPVLNKDDGGKFFGREHRRDCRTVALSMAGEAEFAFVTAIFGLTEGLLTPETYASVSFAILISTIVSPVLLRTSIALHPYENPNSESHDNGSVADDYSDGFSTEPPDSDPEMAKTSRIVKALLDRNPSMYRSKPETESDRVENKRYNNLRWPQLGGYSADALPQFWHIQTMNVVCGSPTVTETSWTLSTSALLRAFTRIQLEVLDHRRWKQRPPSEDAKVVWVYHEFYAMDKVIPAADGKQLRTINERQDMIQSETMDAIDEGAIVMVEAWEPKCLESYKTQQKQQMKQDPLDDNRDSSIIMTNASFVLYIHRVLVEATKLLGEGFSFSGNGNKSSKRFASFKSSSGRGRRLSTLLEGSSDDDLPREESQSGDFRKSGSFSEGNDSSSLFA